MRESLGWGRLHYVALWNDRENNLCILSQVAKIALKIVFKLNGFHIKAGAICLVRPLHGSGTHTYVHAYTYMYICFHKSVYIYVLHICICCTYIHIRF